MRRSILAATSLITALATVPAAAQVSARLDVRVPVGRVGVGSRGALAIGAYAPALAGAWQDDYRYWEPVTVYYYDGEYYDYPIVDYATPVYVYRYNGRLFFPPRDEAFLRLHSRATRFYPPRPRDEFRGEYRTGRSYRNSGSMEYRQRELPSRGDRAGTVAPRSRDNGPASGARSPGRGQAPSRSGGRSGNGPGSRHGHGP